MSKTLVKSRRIALGFAFLLQLCAITARAQFDSGGQYSTNGVHYSTFGTFVSVTGCDPTNAGTLIIPSTVFGVPVTEITQYSFQRPTNVTSIILPNTVTVLDDFAFGWSCATSISLPEGLLSMGDETFDGCTNLATITIPQSVTNIGSGAFEYTPSLAAINVEVGNSYYKSADGVIFDAAQTRLIAYPPAKPDLSYVIPTGVNTIDYFAFYCACNLTNVTIPDTVTTLKLAAFSYSTNLATLHLPASVTNIDDGVFYFTSIDVAPENPSFSSFDGVLYDRNRTTLLYYPVGTKATSFVVPNTVTNIGYPFGASYTNLTALYFRGDAPVPANLYLNSNRFTVYYLPGTSGWSSTYDGVNTAPWTLPNPTILDGGATFGVRNHQLGFTVSWATNATVIVEACTNFFNPVWQPLQTNSITNGSFQFSDPQWTNYPGRFYRARAE